MNVGYPYRLSEYTSYFHYRGNKKKNDTNLFFFSDYQSLHFDKKADDVLFSQATPIQPR